MNLGTKLLAAQVPLIAALAISGVFGGFAMRAVGRSSDRILRENYRSVFASQRMKEAAERIDSGALFIVVGQRERGREQIAAYIEPFEDELRVEHDNITEAGEAEAADRLSALWRAYRDKLEVLVTRGEGESLDQYYFMELEPAFLAVKDAADSILAMNQDAMLRKSREAERLAARSQTLVVVAALLGAVLGLLASFSLTAKLLRPLADLGQAARRIGDGDMTARASAAGSDEVAALAAEFNAMAERLETYHESSLGELLEAREAAQAAIDSLPDPVVVLGPDGRVVNTNEAAQKLLGVAPGGHLAQIDPGFRAALDRLREHVFAGKGPYAPKSFEEAVRVNGPDGERAFLPRAAPLYGEAGGATGATIVLQDVTRLLRLDELRTNLVATVAHEFRTPLTSLHMAIHLCLEQAVGPLTDKQADLLHAARQDCERLQAVVDDMLDLSRAQHGRVPLRCEAVAAEALLHAAVQGELARAKERGVRLEVEPSADAGAAIADADRLSLVFANIIGNAIRHSPEGGLVSLRAARAGGAVRFEITDRGEGVPAEHRERIFERFYQVPGARSGRAGLGLSIAKEVVDAHEGRIGVESEVGKGSTFWFELPAAPTGAS